MSDSIDRLFSFPIGRREPLKRGVYVVKYGDGTSGDEEPAIPDTGVFRARLHAALAAWVGTKAGKRAATARSGRITIRHLSGLLDDADFRPSLLAQLKAQGILHLDVIDYDEHELVDDWFVDDDLLAPEEKETQMSDEPEGPEDFPADVPDPHAEMHAALAQMDLTRQASRAAMLEMQGVLPDHDPDLGTDLAARVKRKLDSLKGPRMAEREPDAIDADLDPELNAQLARAYREAESILATQERVIADAVRFAEGLGLDAGDFDDLVHDAKGYEASEINNGGLSDQLDYLASGSDDPEEYLKGLIQAVASDQDTDAQDADSDAP